MRLLLKKVIIIISFLGLVFFVTNRFIFFKRGFFERTVAYLTYPFLRASDTVSTFVESLKKSCNNHQKLLNKYKKLQKNYMATLDKLIKLKATNHAYSAMKELVEFNKRYKLSNAPMAKVLVKNLSPVEHYFLIDLGSRHNIKKDMIALYKTHLIGRVSEVYGLYSKITLITDHKSKVSAYTSKTNALGIVQGCNNTNECILTYVSHLHKIEDDDLIISSGRGLVFPEGFCLGKIAFHSLKEKDLYHHIQIEPIVNLKTIRYCTLSTYPN